MGRRRRRRPAPHGPWRSAPAGAGWRRHAPPGRRRAAGRWSRSRRTACSLRSPSPPANVTACCSAMPTSKHALGKFVGKQVEAGARGHGRGDGDDLVVMLGFLDQRLGEDLGIARRVRHGLGLGAGHHVELDDAVILVGRLLRRGIAMALAGDAHEPAPGLRRAVAHIAQHRQQMVQIVAVDRPDIEEAQLLEQRAAGHHAAGELLGALGGGFDLARELPGHFLAEMAQRAIGLGGQQPRQIGAHGAHRRRDRHVVVVQHDDQAAIHRAGVVHRLIGHAGAHGAVADDGDDLVLARHRGRAPRPCRGRRKWRSSCGPRRTGRIRSRRAW